MATTNRVKPLTTTEINEFFEETTKGHLAYRLTMLKAHLDRCAPGGQGFPKMYELAIFGFEASLVASRMFLQFLGLGIQQPPLRLIEARGYFDPRNMGASDEVKVNDLGGKFVDISKLTASEQQ